MYTNEIQQMRSCNFWLFCERLWVVYLLLLACILMRMREWEEEEENPIWQKALSGDVIVVAVLDVCAVRATTSKKTLRSYLLWWCQSYLSSKVSFLSSFRPPKSQIGYYSYCYWDFIYKMSKDDDPSHVIKDRNYGGLRSSGSQTSCRTTYA